MSNGVAALLCLYSEIVSKMFLSERYNLPNNENKTDVTEKKNP